LLIVAKILKSAAHQRTARPGPARTAGRVEPGGPRGHPARALLYTWPRPHPFRGHFYNPTQAGSVLHLYQIWSGLLNSFKSYWGSQNFEIESRDPKPRPFWTWNL